MYSVVKIDTIGAFCQKTLLQDASLKNCALFILQQKDAQDLFIVDELGQFVACRDDLTCHMK